MSSADARFGVMAMVCLSLLALVAAAADARAGASQMTALFVLLAAIGTWQAAYYWRHK